MPPPISGRSGPVSPISPAPGPTQANPLPGTYRAAPMVSLATDGNNPFISASHMETAGNALEVVLKDFVAKHLVDGEGRGARVAMSLGSFPGTLTPDLPLYQWDPDKKIDLVVWGDAEVMIRGLAEAHGWGRPVRNNLWDRFNRRFIRADSPRAIRLFHADRPDPKKHATVTDYLIDYAQTKGPVYLPITVKTPQGPIVAKIGLMDLDRWNRGFAEETRLPHLPRGDVYAGQRASLLPLTVGHGGTYHFIHGEADPGFLKQIGHVQADFARHALDSLADHDSFSGKELIERRYRIQFTEYDLLRSYVFFERRKGIRQLARYQGADAQLPAKILAPAFAEVLRADPSYEVRDSAGQAITPDQITGENLLQLSFHNRRSPVERELALARLSREFREIDRGRWLNNWWNIWSGKYALKNPHSPKWYEYLFRKVGLISNGLHFKPFPYDLGASRFTGTPEEIEAQRLRRTGVPLNLNIIVAGYGPNNETHPKTWKKIKDYGVKEIRANKELNLIIEGTNPSKFTFPLKGGVPVVAYRLMEAMRSPAITEIELVGSEDVLKWGRAFQKHFARELAERGTTLTLKEERGGLGKNIAAGLENPRREGRMAVVSFGDVPFADIHNIAYHPWRHQVDFIFGTNGRDMLLDFLGMNAHYAGELEGVEHAFKEGNTQGYRKPPGAFVQMMYEFRKSVGGAAGKFFRVLWQMAKTVPGLTSLPSLAVHALPNITKNILYSKAGLPLHPRWVFSGGPAFEYAYKFMSGSQPDFDLGHLDPRATLDVDGVRDYVLSRIMAELHPYPHQADLEKFVQEALADPQLKGNTGLDGTERRINEMYRRFYEEVLAQEPKITAEILKAKGVDPDVLPFLEPEKEGGAWSVNPDWVKIALPEVVLQNAARAFDAYDRRVRFAGGLVGEFNGWSAESLPYRPEDRVSPDIEQFVQKQINGNPEYFRGLILEDSFHRLQQVMTKAARREFGLDGDEVQELQRYFKISFEEKRDTPLRKLGGGLRAVDVLRRYEDYLSPAEFQEIFPKLNERLDQARQVIPGNRWVRGLPKGFLWDDAFLLRRYLDHGKKTADASYVRKVGESPPSARARGLTAGRFLPRSHARLPIRQTRPTGIEVNTEGRITGVDSAVWHPNDLERFARRAEIMPSRIPHLMAAAAGAKDPSHLHLIPEKRLTAERLLAWTNTEAGQRFLAQDPYRVKDTFKNRLHEGGIPLAAGLAALVGAEYLADRVGLDPLTQPHERFMAVVGLSHLMGQAVAANHEVYLNQESLKVPFDFVKTRVVQMGSSHGIQYSLESRGEPLAARWASLTRYWPLEGGVLRMGLQGLKNVGGFFLRTPLGMGSGLMSAALVNQGLEAVERAVPIAPKVRNGIHLGAFFLPQMGELAFGRKLPVVFRGPTFRFASRAFAAGFIADMAFTAHNRIVNGNQGAVKKNMIYQRANALHDADHGNGLWDGALELVAPQLAAWWDSVDWDGLIPFPNRYQEQAEGEMNQYLSRVDSQSREYLQGLLLDGLGDQAFHPNFYTRLDWDVFRKDPKVLGRGPDGKRLPVDLFLRDLEESPQIRAQFASLSTEAAQARFIRRRYSGWNLSPQDARRLLERAFFMRVRADLAAVQDFPMESGVPFKGLFDSEGRLTEGSEPALLSSLFGNKKIKASDILAVRRERLARRIRRLEGETSPEGRSELAGFRQVAEKIGMDTATPSSAPLAQNGPLDPMFSM